MILTFLNLKMSSLNTEVIMITLIVYNIAITAALIVAIAYYDKRIQSLNQTINDLSKTIDDILTKKSKKKV